MAVKGITLNCVTDKKYKHDYHEHWEIFQGTSVKLLMDFQKDLVGLCNTFYEMFRLEAGKQKDCGRLESRKHKKKERREG